MKKILSIILTVTMVFSLVAAFRAPTASAVAVSYVTTNPATVVTSNDATLNGTNGSSAATGHSFWVSLATFDTSSPIIPAGVYSTPDFVAITANTAFSASLSSITTTGVPTSLPAVTPGTTYYFAAWSLVGGTWYPGEILNFITLPLPGALSAEDFGVVDYDTGLGQLKGYTAGFGLTDATFTGASVVVRLYAAGDQLLQTNTLIGVVTGTQISSPFDVLGTFNYVTDGYWTNVKETEYGQSIPATKVVATVTLANGKVVTAENTNLTGDLKMLLHPITEAATGVTSTAATLNGLNGDIAATNEGFWYGTSSHGPFSADIQPDVASQMPGDWSSVIATTQNFAVNGAFSISLTGLLTPATQYYFVAWSFVGDTWYPGEVLTFTTLPAFDFNPITEAATGVTSTAATLNGLNGDIAATNEGFWYGTSSHGPFSADIQPDVASQMPGDWSSVIATTQNFAVNGAFSISLTGLLTPATQYYFVAWALVGGIWYPGDVLSFTTSATYTPLKFVGPFAPLMKNGNGTGQFKAGSTIPVKFQLTDGTNLITTATGTVTINGVSAAFRWDATAQQYIANVKTGKAVTGTMPVVLVVDQEAGSQTIATINLR